MHSGSVSLGGVTADYRVCSAHELIGLLDRAGLAVTGLYGDYDLAPFHVHAPHIDITAIAEKK